MKIRYAFKSIPIQLDSIHSEFHHTTVNALEWKGEHILMKYMKGHTRWSFPSTRWSFPPFPSKSYGGSNGNPLFLTGLFVILANTYSLIAKVDY